MMLSKLASVHWLSQWHTAMLLCLASLATSLIGSNASRADELETVSGRAMGTSYSLKYSERGQNVTKDDLAATVSDELARLESIFSLYREDSEISRFNTAPGGEWIQVSEDFYAVTKFAAELSEMTGGAFDPTLKPLVELWQGDRLSGDLLSGDWKPPSHESIEAALKTVGASHLAFQVEPLAIRKESAQVQLDLNALVEGWAIERVLDLLELKGCDSALFELGGEYGAIGFKPDGELWQVGIEDPQALSKIYATLSLHDEALCTSGVYRQVRQYAGKQYGHIIDPRTGYPVDHDCLSVSVLHTDAMIADGWATALMVLGPEQGLELADKAGLAACFAHRSGSSISPKVSQRAYGKIVTTHQGVQLNGQAVRLVFAGVLVCIAAVVSWFIFRRRERRKSEPTALAAGLEVVVEHEKQANLSAKSIKKLQHWPDGLQIEPPDFETRG